MGIRGVGGTVESGFDLGDERLDAVFRALGDRRRRFLLYLLSENAVIDRDWAVESILAWETERSGEERPTRTRPESVEVELEHVHLPLLEAAGLVKYDRRGGEIRRDVFPPVINDVL